MFSQQRAVQSLLTECHSDVHRHIKRFVFTLFGFTLFFVSCHFLVLSRDLFLKRQPSEKRKKKKKSSPLGYVCITYEQQQGEVIHSQCNLLSWDIYVILFNESVSALTDLTDFETCSETRRVCVWFNVSGSWTAELTLFSYGNSVFSPSKHFSTLSLTTCHDFCPEHDCR